MFPSPSLSSYESRASQRNSDLRVRSPLGMATLGAMMMLSGAVRRRSLFSVGLMLGGAAVLFRTFFRRAPSSLVRRSTRPRPGGNGLSQKPGVPDQLGTKLVRSIHIDAPRKAVFKFVRDLEKAPQYLRGIEAVQILDDRRSHWTARTPVGETAEWYLEIINEHPDELIAWQTLEASELEIAGSIRFKTWGDGSTEVKVSLEYHLLGSGFGGAVADIIGAAPERQLVADLGRLKFLIESRESGSSVSDSGFSW